MTLNEMIQQLIDLRDEHGGEDNGDNIEVRLAIQPRWAFEHAISDIVAVDLNDTSDEEEDGEPPAEEEEKVVVYIGEGQQLGYLPGVAGSELGFGR